MGKGKKSKVKHNRASFSAKKRDLEEEYTISLDGENSISKPSSIATIIGLDQFQDFLNNNVEIENFIAS